MDTATRNFPHTWQRPTARTIKMYETDRIDKIIGRGPDAPERATKFASAGAAASITRAASQRSLASDFEIDPKLVAEQTSLGKSGSKGARSAASDYKHLVGAARRDLATARDPDGLVAGRKAGALSGASSAFQVDHSAETAPPRILKEAANFPIARVHEIAREQARKGMFSANPPVDVIIEDQRRQQQLRAAAVSMARSMMRTDAPSQQFYSVEQAALHHRPLALHNAAIQNARQQVNKADDYGTAMREWYIPSEESATKPHKAFSLPWKMFKPVHAVGNRSKDDDESEYLDPVEAVHSGARYHNAAQRESVQRSKDRANLMAIAQENTNKTMLIIDEDMCIRTGKPNGAMFADAEYRDKLFGRMKGSTRTPETVAIGGGKMVEVGALNELARDRVHEHVAELEAHGAADDDASSVTSGSTGTGLGRTLTQDEHEEVDETEESERQEETDNEAETEDEDEDEENKESNMQNKLRGLLSRFRSRLPKRARLEAASE